ncbi:MAG: hypothetical protein R6X17_02110, partial [Candidatus Competibacteraceae bacterium]
MNPQVMTGDAARRSHANPPWWIDLRTLPALMLVLALMLLSAAPASTQELFAVTPLDPLQATEQQHARQQTLDELRVELERQQQQLIEAKDELPSKIQALQVGQVTESLREQTQADDQTLRLREEDILAGIADSQRQVRVLSQDIQRMEAQEQLLRNPVGTDLDSGERSERLELTQLALSQKRADLALDQQQLKLRQDWLEVTQQERDLAEQWRNRVEEIFFLQQEQSRREAREDLNTQLAQARQAQIERAAELRRRLQRDGERLGEIGRLLLETQAQSAEAQARLIALDKRLAQGDSAL